MHSQEFDLKCSFFHPTRCAPPTRCALYRYFQTDRYIMVRVSNIIVHSKHSRLCRKLSVLVLAHLELLLGENCTTLLTQTKLNIYRILFGPHKYVVYTTVFRKSNRDLYHIL